MSAYGNKVVGKKLKERLNELEELLNKDEYEQYLQRPAWIIQGQILTNPEEAGKLYQQLVEMQKQKQQQQDFLD